MRGAEQGDDLIDMAEIVACEDAEGIADDIIEAAASKIKIDVPGFLFRSGLVQKAARHECRSDRIVARTAWLGCDRRRWVRRRGGPCRCRRGHPCPLPFPLPPPYHPRPFLAPPGPTL